MSPQYRVVEVSPKDIEKLDFLLGVLVETEWLVTANDLVEAKYYTHHSDPDLLSDFKRYLVIFDHCNAAKVTLHADVYQANTTRDTHRFHIAGGFKAYFEREAERKRIEQEEKALERRKAEVDLNLAERTLKDYPWTKWAARIAFIISIILAAFELLRVFNIIK